MPAVAHTPNSSVTKFTNCRLLRGSSLVQGDLWVSSSTGKILRSQEAFYDEFVVPDEVVDLGGRILAPGLIECQLNGAFGFNFSTLMDDNAEYSKEVAKLNRQLVRTGVTSYIPTITSQIPELYHKVLPFLAPSGHKQIAQDGAESLGAHVEGPFLNPGRHGAHNVGVMRWAETWSDLEECYGAENINPSESGDPIPVLMVTAAPEIGNMTNIIPEITSRGIIYSMGHSEATYKEASAAVAAGATMITHLFNAMNPLHHRNPGIFGVLGGAKCQQRPYFGIIADGIHLHPTAVNIAFNTHPDGFILVTDAMHMVGLPDGSYIWTNGDKINRLVKHGTQLHLEGSNTLAGSTITLIECVSNFLSWSGASIPDGLRAVTATPAAMLGLRGVKGSLEEHADADLVVLSEKRGEGSNIRLEVDEVWKFGTRAFRKDRHS